MTTKTLTPQETDFLEAHRVPESLHALIGTVWFFIGEGGRLIDGNVLTRGDSFTITVPFLASSLDRFGHSWLEALADDAAQIERWGSVVFTAELPADFVRLVPGSSAWRLAKKAAMDRAARYPVGPLRQEALAEVEAEFGPGEVSPPKSRWVYPDAPANGGV